MKKIIVKDEDGRKYEVEEVEEEKEIGDEDEEETAVLTTDEIAALKQLAAAAPDIMKLLEVEKKEHEAVGDKDEDKDVEDEDEDEEDIEEEDIEEEIVDTDSKKMKKDSKKSFVSNRKKETRTDDSLDDSVANAWAKRYGGVK